MRELKTRDQIGQTAAGIPACSGSQLKENRAPTRRSTRGQRFKARLIGWAGYFAISLISRTVRWQSEGDEHLEDIHQIRTSRDLHVLARPDLSGNLLLAQSRHCRHDQHESGWRSDRTVHSAIWLWRGARIEFARRPARAGAARRDIQRGKDAAFTIDGPRGPRYVAKQGPVLLAFKTGAAIFCFHISMKRKIQLRSWDEFQIPLPFTTAIVLKAPPIWVPPNATEEQLRALHEQMQKVLDDLRVRGDAGLARTETTPALSSISTKSSSCRAKRRKCLHFCWCSPLS